MAVHDTEENGRTDFTERTLTSLFDTVNLDKHRLIVINNNSCDRTSVVLRSLEIEGCVIHNGTNVGTARAVNKGIALREPGEFVIKIDNDVVIHKKGWVEDMEEVIRRMPSIGILGLKRDDLMESPYAINTDQRSRLLMVPHETGQRWRIVEECKHVMGTCTMLNPALLDRIGYFYQHGVYGFDDSLLCVRSTVAGFLNCFLPGIDIDHIDPGGNAYTDWKAKHAAEMIGRYSELEAAYKSGAQDVYYGGE
jgi:GT2 family glycosyltransferase